MSNFMKMIDERTYENKEKGVNVCIIKTDTGRKFKGIARCKEEDMEYYSSILGGTIANYIAKKKYYAAVIKNTTRLLNTISSLSTEAFQEECRQDLIKAQISYDEICKNMSSMIEEYFKLKKRIKNYLERKRKGLPLTMTEDLQIKANKLREMSKKKR